MPLPRFGELLRQHRQTAGFSQELLAERARMSVDAVSALERGVRRAPHTATLELLLAALEPSARGATELKEAAARGRARSSEPVAKTSSGGNLSFSVTTFIGRQTELEELRKLLADEGCRLVTISGPGGVGKSRLALEVAQHVAGNDGWIVSLANLVDPARVAETIAEALCITFGPDESALDAVQRGLRTSDTVVIIDNCEHLIDSVAEVVSAVIAACPRLRIVATSRERLRIHGEVVFALSPLPSSDAIALFVQRGAPFFPELATLHAADVPAVADIVRQLDGLPLAIELTVPMLRLFGVDALATRLRERLRTPVRGNRDAPERHQTIEGIVDWSYQRLSAHERTVFEACSVFAGTFALEAILDVCATGTVSDEETIDAFSALLDKSLVAFADVSRTRYFLLETIRAYAIEAARRSGRLDALRSRFAAHYVALAEGFETPLSGADRIRKVTRLKADRQNIEAALTWALVDAADCVTGARLLLGAAELLEDEAFSTSRHWFDRACRLVDQETHPQLWSEVTIAAQIYLQYSPDWLATLPTVERAVEILRSCVPPRTMAKALLWLAASYGNAGDQERCDVVAAEAVAFARHEDARFLSHMLHVTAGLMADGDFERRRLQIEEGLRIYEPDAPAANWANSYANLSEAQYLSGDLRAALASVGRAVDIVERVDNNDVIRMVILSTFASLALLSGDLAGGIDAARRAIELARGLNDPVLLAIALQQFAYALALSGDLERAALLIGFVDRRIANITLKNLPPAARECHRRLSDLLSADDFRPLERRGANWTDDQAIEATVAPATM